MIKQINMTDETLKFLQDIKKNRLSVDSLESIVDDIFAVAMTILAFTIVVPSIGQVNTIGLSNYLNQFGSQLSLLIICFIILGNNWVTERELLSSVEKIDRTLIDITLILLIGVTSYPISMNLINTLGNEYPIFIEYYHLNKLFVAILFVIQWIHISSNQLHLKKSWNIRSIKHNIKLIDNNWAIKTLAFKIFYYPIVVIIALIMSYWYPGPSRYVYVLLLLKPMLTKYNEKYYFEKIKEKINNDNIILSNISNSMNNMSSEYKNCLDEISKNFNDLDLSELKDLDFDELEENRRQLIDIVVSQHQEIRENIAPFEALKKENKEFDSDNKIEYYVKYRAIMDYYKKKNN